MTQLNPMSYTALMVRTFFVFALLGLSVSLGAQSLSSGPDLWQPTYAAAQQLALKEGKPIAVLFTGGNWCQPALRLKIEVLDDAQFALAAKSFVWFQIAFPQQEEQAPEADLELAANLGVTSLPEVILISPQGLPFGRFTGYHPGGAEAFLAALQALSPQQARLETLQKAVTSSTTTADKLKALDALYREAERDKVAQARVYAALPQAISRLDPASGGLGDRYRLWDEYTALTDSWSKTVDWAIEAQKLSKLASRAQTFPHLHQTLLVTLGALYFDALHNEEQAKSTLLQALALGNSTDEAHQARRLLDRLP